MAHSHFRPTHLEANSVFKWPQPSQGLLGSTVRRTSFTTSPLPSGFGPLPLGDCSLASPGVQAHGDGQGPSASSSQACSQAGTLGTHCAWERLGFLGEWRLSVPGGWLQPRAHPLTEPSGLQRGWNSTPAQECPFQLCKTLHESLHVPDTRFRPVDAADQADSPAAVLVRKEAAIWAGRRKSGPLGRGCLLQGVPRDLPPPWQPGLPWGGSWPSTGRSRGLWSSRWRKPRCPLCFRGHGWVHLDQLCLRHLLAHLPQPGLLPDSEE